MKRIPILLLTLLLASHLHAQSSSRLVAFAGWGNDTTIAPNDTGGYAYSNGRGGQISTLGYGFGPAMSFKCDFPFALVPSYDFETLYSGVIKYDSAWELASSVLDKSFQTFDAENNIVYAIDLIPDSSGVWQNNRAASYSYDAHHNLVNKSEWSWNSIGVSTIPNQYLYSYDGYNRLTSMIEKLADTTLKLKSIYAYDGLGNLVECTGERWNNTTGVWDSQSDTRFYYAGTQVDTFIVMGSDWGTYYFSPTNDTMVFNRYFAWSNYMRITRTYDTHHNETSLTYDVLDPTLLPPFTPSYRVEWSYNSFNQIIAEHHYNKDSLGNWIFSSMHRYYYELYTSGVKEIERPGEILLYPNPATDQVTITSSEKISSIVLINLIGQSVYKHDYNAEKVQVDISNLPSGVYLARINGTEIRKIVKQ